MHISLLHETKQNPACKTSEVMIRSKICRSLIEDSLVELQMAGAVTLADEVIYVTPEQRLRIAELAMTKGADPERVARELGWQEFESLAGRVLSREGYATSKHFILKHSGHKHEIDVVGAKEPLVLCVDCKHWHHGWAPSKIMKAAEQQLLRVQSLSEVFTTYRRKLRVMGWRSVRLLPAVLTLADLSSKMIGGVPIVSVLRLRDFLCQIDPWEETLRYVDVPPSLQTLLVSAVGDATSWTPVLP